MKYTIGGILLIAAILLVWILRTGSREDAALMVIAIISVTFFASVPNLWNALYPAKPRSKDVANKVPEGATVVRLSPPADNNNPAGDR